MGINRPIKNIIFDFGGVILDIDSQQIEDNLKQLGFTDFNPQRLQELEENIVSKFERGILTADVFRKKFREFLGFSISNQEIDDVWNSMLLDIPHERIEVLEQVKKHYTMFLLSNSNEIHYEVFLRDLQLRFGYNEFDDLFHRAYFSFDLHLSKPNPEIFEFVLYQHKLVPEETLFIDDLEIHIEAAKKLGLRTYHLQKPERVRDLFVNGVLREDLL